ncbi:MULTISPECIES: hypothetical protein [Emticicia]|uniref:hypothetical protein n=1 Tax=Emticicia TaxID=312278 RepID=UPI0007D8B507|nr:MULTISPECIES: hypothetical protein [Emticicia]
MENNKYASFTDERLLEKQRKNKMGFNLFVALFILLFILLCFSFGYYIGADAATDGQGKFHGTPFLFPLFFLVLLYFTSKKDRKEFEEEIKKRNL